MTVRNAFRRNHFFSQIRSTLKSVDFGRCCPINIEHVREQITLRANIADTVVASAHFPPAISTGTAYSVLPSDGRQYPKVLLLEATPAGIGWEGYRDAISCSRAEYKVWAGITCADRPRGSSQSTQTSRADPNESRNFFARGETDERIVLNGQPIPSTDARSFDQRDLSGSGDGPLVTACL